MNNPLLVEGGGLLSPNVIKGKKTTTKSHSRYFHAVLYETGSLCKANNVKWGGEHREKPHLQTKQAQRCRRC